MQAETDLKQLLDRIRYLEENRRYVQNALETVLSVGDFQEDVSRQPDPGHILEKAQKRIRDLIPFQATALYLVDETSSNFVLAACQPDHFRKRMRQKVETLIDKGFFAWALGEKKGVLIDSEDLSVQFFLHVIATRSRTRGMFVGLFSGRRHQIPEASSALLSIILLNTANALEDLELYRLLRRRNKILETRNEQLTREINERIVAEKALKKGIEYFQLHSGLATELIKAPAARFDQAIELALKRMVEFFGVDRGTIVYWPGREGDVRDLYSWKRAGINPYRMMDSYHKCTYLINILLKGRVFAFSSIDELPPQARVEKEYYMKEGIRSGVRVPLDIEGTILGVLILDCCQGEKPWTDEEVQQIQFLGQTFTYALHRKYNEKRLRESEDKLRAIFDNVNDEIVYMDSEGTILEVNKRVENIFGYKPEEVIGKNIMDIQFIRPKEKDTLAALYSDLISGNLNNLAELSAIRKDGKKISIEASTRLIKQEGRIKNILVVVRDITERKKLEDRLRQAQKMEAIGALSGGVAHDLNNILSGVVSYPELLLMNLPEDSPMRKPILTIKKSGEKAAGIVNDLLTLARRGVVVSEVVNLNDVVREYLESPEHEKLKFYHPQVEIHTDFETDLPNILGSPVHLSKTVMNLISNAAEAISEQGDIFISTRKRFLEKPLKSYNRIEKGVYAALTVSDTGEGISSEDLKRIFEPFYSKKVMGRSGTGLGMAVVWGTVKDHKGYIDLESREGKGTSITLYFPVTGKKHVRDQSVFSVEEVRGSGESVLVVDDVEEQRTIASELLQELGYSVASVSSGEQAIDYVRNNKPDLLLLDMIMDPGMNGLETYRRILELNPFQKAIIASGFSKTEHVKEAQRLGAGNYVKKPYTLEQLGKAVKNELKKAPHTNLRVKNAPITR